MKKTLLLVVATIVSSLTLAQEIASHTFTDNTEQLMSRARTVFVEGDFAYIGGNTQNGCGNTPYVQKVNIVTGEVIWNTATTASYVEFEEEFKVYNVQVIGDYVYAFVNLPSTFGRLWRIDKTTGEVGWRAQWFDATEHDQVHPYSATQVITYSYNKFRLVNISDGAVTDTHTFHGWSSFSVGKNGNIFLTGLPVMRVSNFDFANPTEVVNFDLSQGCGGSGSMGARMFELDNDKLLMFGFPCGQAIVLVDLITKQVIWRADAGAVGYDFSSYSIRGNDLFVSYKPANGENMLYGMRASRINFTTGQIIWNSEKFFSREYDDDTALEAYYRPQGNAVSVDGDNAGNVYLTGVAGTSGSLGDWGVMKLAAANGDLVYEKIIEVSSKKFDRASHGMRVVVRDDVPYFIGNMLVPWDGTDDMTHEDAAREVTIVKLNATTGATQSTTKLNAQRPEHSFVQKILPFDNSSTLILQNNGPLLTITRYDEDMDVMWTKEFSFPTQIAESVFYSTDLAVDKNGNIVVLSNRERRGTDGHAWSGYAPNDIFILDKDGNFIKQEYSGFTTSPDNELMLGINAQDFFVLNGDTEGSSSSAVIRFTHDEAISGTSPLGIELTPTHTPRGRRMAQLADGRLLILGNDLTARISNSVTLETTEPVSRLFASGDLTTAHDIIVLRDTLYVAAASDNSTYKSLFAYSMITRQAIWSYTGTDGKFYKLMFDNDGKLYAAGNNGDGEVIVHKLNRKTGAKLWSSFQPAGDVTDMIYDIGAHEIVLSGSTNSGGIDYFSTIILNALDGEAVYHDIQDDYPGTSLTVGMTANGRLIAGGKISGIDNCVTSSLQIMYTRNPLRPIEVNATDDLDNGVTITWSQQGNASHFQVFRSTINSVIGSEPISEWINVESYNDDTANPGVQYYYFIKSAQSDEGDNASHFSLSGEGSRILSAPEIENLAITEETAVELSWNDVEAGEFYKVYRGVTNGEDAAIAISGWINTTTYVDNTVEPGNTYFYFIKAATDEDGSFASNLSSDGEILVPAVTGIDDGSFAAFAIYPNPTKEQFTIRYDSDYQGEVKVNLLTAMGSDIGATSVTKNDAHFEHTFLLDESVRGTIIVIVNEGKRVTHRKVVKL